MLTGSDLLASVNELGDVSKSDLVCSCGSVSSKKDGSDRLHFTAFYEALLEALGVSLGAGVSIVSLSYEFCTFNASILKSSTMQSQRRWPACLTRWALVAGML